LEALHVSTSAQRAWFRPGGNWQVFFLRKFASKRDASSARSEKTRRKTAKTETPHLRRVAIETSVLEPHVAKETTLLMSDQKKPAKRKPRPIKFDGPARIIASFPNNQAMLDFIGQSLAIRGGIPVTTTSGQKCRIRFL
jgi:hypothetical protein